MSFLTKPWPLAIVLVILLGIGAFMLYTDSKPNDSIATVYVLPESDSRRADTLQVTRVRQPGPTQEQENSVQTPSEENLIEDGYHEQSDESAQHISDIYGVGSPTRYVRTVSPEFIEDAKHQFEYNRAFALHLEKETTYYAEGDALIQQVFSLANDFFATLPSEDRAFILDVVESESARLSAESDKEIVDRARQAMLASFPHPEDSIQSLKTQDQIVSEAEALLPKIESWGKRGEQLFEEAPSLPIPLHTH